MARKVIDEWAFGSVVREGPDEFMNFPGSFAEYLIKEAEESAKHCDFIGCGNDAVPGSDDCAEHQHAVAVEHHHGTQSTVICACRKTFGPIGEPNDRRLQNHADALALHAKHAANS